MIDPTVPIGRAFSILSWTLGAALIVAGWAVYLANFADLGVMLAISGVPFIAVAGLLLVRCWVTRLCQVVRVTSGQCGDPTGVLPFR